VHRNRTLRYSLLRGRYAICKLDSGLPIPAWASEKLGLVSITRNPDELSIVCAENSIPAEVHASRGWVCVKLQGPFAFSETGVLSAFINPLAEHGIGIFAVSTFDTDYVLIQENEWLRASEVLRAAGHEEFSS
jgi:uncharacterized protein